MLNNNFTFRVIIIASEKNPATVNLKSFINCIFWMKTIKTSKFVLEATEVVSHGIH